jgi:hypothetical protein
MQRLFITLFILFTTFSAVYSQTISEKTSGLEYYEGYFDFWWDDANGKIWLKIDKFDEEFLYVYGLAAGMGSNDIGLDRGQLGSTQIVRFNRVGPRVLMVQPNYSFRATSENWLERKSVDEAFAQSVHWGFTVVAEEDGAVLVDATDFLLRDAHGVANTLRSRNQGNFSPDRNRSAIYLPSTFNFPKNTEFEATITFTGAGAGGFVRSVTPSGDAITVRQHHSFIELPDDNYTPRKFDPRSGYFATSFQDYSAPIGGDLTTRYIARHRLEKKDPNADVSEAVEPIVYYLDNGTPEPVRTALLEGARWWNQAFEAIGYKDAFRVEVLPADAHPMDVRYNVIQWVHRSTRGWSYGSSVRDPRTGEIIKGHVSLGSLRVRQDFMIAEGLLAPYADGQISDDPMLEMALARIRQLSAHEIGHTIGIAHNFAASVNNDASVMDYPHPQVTINPDGSFDLSNAYDDGIGAWDIRAVAYGYQHFPDGVDEDEALKDIVEETSEMGLMYITDSDARPQSGAHPYAHLWEYGNDPVGQLDHIMSVRRLALDRFSENNIRTGRPMGNLEDVLVPIYLYHRYQSEATVKLIGGVDYSYTVRGDGQPGPVTVDAQVQRNALTAMIKTLNADELALPQTILDIIPPQPPGFGGSREQFRGYTNPVMDPFAMAETASDLTASLIFNPTRAARLVVQNARNSSSPSLQDVITTVLDASVKRGSTTGYEGAIQRSVNVSVTRNLLQLAANRNASPDVQGITALKVSELKEYLTNQSGRERLIEWKAHYNYLTSLIERYESDPDSFRAPAAPYTPPGSPIGSGEAFFDYCEFHDI